MHSIPLNFQTIQRIFLVIGVVGLLVSCMMTYKFGSTMSWLHAVALCAATIVAAFIFPAKKFISDLGFTGAAKSLKVLGVFFICLELFSHLGYTIGMREKSTMEAGVQTAAYGLQQESVKSEVANMDMWRKQLADMKARNASHMERNQGWLVSVDPAAMEAQMAAMDQKIENEAKRVRCARKCEELKTQRGQLAALIGNIKEENDLTARIEATQRILDGKTQTAVAAKSGFSAARAQTDFVSQLYLIVSGTEAEQALNPDQTTLSVTGMLIGLFIAIGATALPTTAFYVAFFGAKAPKFDEEDEITPAKVWDRQAKRNEAQKASATFAKHSEPQQPKVYTREIVRTDGNVWRDLNAALNG